MKGRGLRGAVVVSCVLAAAPRAHSADLFGGYSYARREGSHLHGAALAVTWPFKGSLRLAVDATAQAGLVGGTDLSEQALMAGPVFAPARERRWSPFAHVKAGVVRLQSEVGVFGIAIGEEGVCEGRCPGDLGFGAEAGGGLDLRVRDRWRLRLPQVDYRWTFLGGERASSLRLSAGVVFRWGR